AAVLATRRGERGAGELLRVQAMRDLLRRIAPDRQGAGDRLGREFVAEAGHVATARHDASVARARARRTFTTMTHLRSTRIASQCRARKRRRRVDHAKSASDPSGCWNLVVRPGPALQHPALHLVALDALEQRLEIAFAEALVALALDDLEEDRPERIGGEDL